METFGAVHFFRPPLVTAQSLAGLLPLFVVMLPFHLGMLMLRLPLKLALLLLGSPHCGTLPVGAAGRKEDDDQE